MKYVGLLDCNNFFVSCERLFRPDLRTRPTVVLSSNDGCVVARSKEVKELGIPMGIPYFQVQSILKDAGVAVFSSNFTLYRDISARVMSALADVVGDIEQYSVDEAFFALDEERVEETIRTIRTQLEQYIGIPVSIGAAKTKTIAKYASTLGKKGIGTSVLAGDTWFALASSIPVHEIWGIGGKTSQKMKKLGLGTVAELIAADRERIQRIFGVGGLRIYDELREQPVRTTRDHMQKSIMSTRSFRASTDSASVVEDAIAYHVAHAAKEMREQGLCAQYIEVLARPSRHGDFAFQGGSAGVYLSEPTDDTRVLLKEAQRLFRSFYTPDVPYKKAGVILSAFMPTAYRTESLFSSESSGLSSSRAVVQVMDALNARYGHDTLTIGRVRDRQSWDRQKSHISPAYTTKWTELPTAKA